MYFNYVKLFFIANTGNPPPPQKNHTHTHLYTGYRGVPRNWDRGAKNYFFRFGNLHVAKRLAFLGGGSGACPPREFFFKLCNLVHFGAYFDQILSLETIIYTCM